MIQYKTEIHKLEEVKKNEVPVSFEMKAQKYIAFCLPFHFFTGCHKCVSLIYLDATEHTEVGRKFFHASFPAREHLDDSGPPLWLMVSSLSKCV